MYCYNASLTYWSLWGLCCPLYPLPTQQSCDCLSLCELSTFIPSLQSFCARRRAQPDCFQRKSGSTLRVIPTLMCARVTSLDSAQALPKNREGSDLSPPNPTAGVTLPRPPLRTSALRTRPRRNVLPGPSRQKICINTSSEIQKIINL